MSTDLRADLRALVARMRSEGPRYKSHDLGYVDSVSANTVDDWADELEVALNAAVSDAVGEPVMSASRLKREAIQRAAQPAPDLAPSVDCPLCGVTVEQVSSATLSLALSQHVRWACPKQPPDLAQIRAEVEKELLVGRDQTDGFKRGVRHCREVVLAILDRHLSSAKE